MAIDSSALFPRSAVRPSDAVLGVGSIVGLGRSRTGLIVASVADSGPLGVHWLVKLAPGRYREFPASALRPLS